MDEQEYKPTDESQWKSEVLMRALEMKQPESFEEVLVATMIEANKKSAEQFMKMVETLQS